MVFFRDFAWEPERRASWGRGSIMAMYLCCTSDHGKASSGESHPDCATMSCAATN